MAPSTARVLLRKGIEKAAGTSKECSRRINYSDTMLSKILNGERNIAPGLQLKLSQMHMIAMLAIAKESTGCSDYTEGDRHPQNLLQRVMKEDNEADEALRFIGWRLIDKTSREHLTAEDVTALKTAAREMSHRIKADLNLLIEWEDRYQLGLLDELVNGKEKGRGIFAESRAD